MNGNLTKAETSTLLSSVETQSMNSLPKKPRTSEDFYLFCKFILEYENYGLTKEEEDEYQNNNESEDDTDKPTSNDTDDSNTMGDMSSDDSYDLVTCFCQKPFAGRPMIECSSCFTWLHLRCVKIKKSEIPDVFICPACKKRQN